MHKSCDPNNCDNCGQCKTPEKSILQQANAIMNSLLVNSKKSAETAKKECQI